jgi:GT2 family glycosyltransferase
VYVDSGSSDGSAKVASQLGAEVVDLDLSTPFTAARARNAGFDRLLAMYPSIELVQFVDGDCQIVPGWMDKAVEAMKAGDRLAVVCGRRRERFPDASLYNALCDMEWNTPAGEALACGGDALVRVASFKQVGGYNPELIAGEEPELCLRLRRAGWRILRLDADMTIHDAAMTRFAQWWRRAFRAGHAYAESAAMHGASPDRFRSREARSNWWWGLALPLLALTTAVPSRGVSVALWVLLVLLLVYRVRRRMMARGFAARDSGRYALFVALGKVPQALGQMRYWLGRLAGARSEVIEYKG